MFLPGMDAFTVTPPLSHAIFALHDAIPAGCESIKAEFDERGAAFVTAFGPDGEPSDIDVTLSDDTMAAAGMLLTLVSYQVATLNVMYEAQGEDAIDAALDRLKRSLADVGLAFGLLTETLDDSITVIRR